MTLLLTQSWTPGSEVPPANTPDLPDEAGRPGFFLFRVVNLGEAPVEAARLCYASMTRLSRNIKITGAALAAHLANHVELCAHPAPRRLAPGEAWEIRINGLTHSPLNQSQGAMAAWVETPDGAALPVRCEALSCAGGGWGRREWPEGALAVPLALLPWPAEVALEQWHTTPRPFSPGNGMPVPAFERVAALHQRLFPNDPPALAHGGGIPVTAAPSPTPLPAGGYHLHFTPEAVALHHSCPAGLLHGLVALAQIAHGARTDARFSLPARGVIRDAPRFDWRGSHIDVARNFRPLHQLYRLADILAWHRMNQLHLHLTDDEAWRLESAAFAELTEVGSVRARGTSLPPQYADGAQGQAGHYTRKEMAGLIAHCTNLGITITPEIDLPGHTYALMQAIPGLRDPQEPADSYRSVQGYPNNALNPGLSRSYEVVETLLDEVCSLFPGPIVHLGGDEVDARAWHASPAAQRLRQRENLAPGAMALQAYFLRRCQEMLQARGKQMGGWDECAEGGGVVRENTTLFAWRSPEQTAHLLREGYQVIATPGQAYYLDMFQADSWLEPGTSWAGAVSPETCYRFEVTDGLPDGAVGLLGVQAGIWSEHLNSTERWNYMVFPRFCAIAEAAWTQPHAKDWPRFCALSRLMPQL